MAVSRRVGYWVLAATLGYVAAFVALRYGYLASHPEDHPTVRAVYAKAFYPLRRLVTFQRMPAEKFEIGTIKDRADKALAMDFLDTAWTTTFECEPSVCAAVQRLPLGREIGLHLVWELGDDDRFNRRLLDARLCLPQDAACDASRQAQTAELTRLHKELDTSREKFQACDAQMAADMTALGFVVTPAADALRSAPPASQEALDTPQMQDCLRRHDERFAEAAFKSCERHRCGDGIGGGCWHIVPDFVTQRAFLICRAALAANTTPTGSR